MALQLLELCVHAAQRPATCVIVLIMRVLTSCVLTHSMHSSAEGLWLLSFKGPGSGMQGLHRLDVDTSGVLLFAKTADVVPHVHAQFRACKTRKEYLAVVLGSFGEAGPDCNLRTHPAVRCAPLPASAAPAHGHAVSGSEELKSRLQHGAQAALRGARCWRIDASLAQHPANRCAACVSSGADSKAAQTDVAVLAQNRDVQWPEAERSALWEQQAGRELRGAALVRCWPHTGVNSCAWHGGCYQSTLFLARPVPLVY